MTVPTLTANNIITSAETDNGNLTVTGTATLNGISNTGTCTTNGDIKYNNNTSLMTQMSTLNSYKTSGTISGTSTLQTIYTVALGTRGFITVIAMAPNYNMFMGFFEWTTSGTYQSLTRLAQAGKNTQGVLNTTNASTGGTVTLTAQQVPNAGTIQASVTINSTINCSVTLI